MVTQILVLILEVYNLIGQVFIVLQHLRKRLPLAQFFKVINDKPIASQLFEGWAKIHDRELLKDFYYQDDRKSASAGILIEESGEQTVYFLTSKSSTNSDPCRKNR